MGLAVRTHSGCIEREATFLLFDLTPYLIQRQTQKKTDEAHAGMGIEEAKAARLTWLGSTRTVAPPFGLPLPAKYSKRFGIFKRHESCRYRGEHIMKLPEKAPASARNKLRRKRGAERLAANEHKRNHSACLENRWKHIHRNRDKGQWTELLSTRRTCLGGNKVVEMGCKRECPPLPPCARTIATATLSMHSGMSGRLSIHEDAKI